MKTFNQKVEELKQLKTMLKEIENKIEKSENEIKQEMTKKGKNEITAGIFVVRYKSIESNRLDTSALKKEHPRIAKKYNKKVITKRLTIS